MGLWVYDPVNIKPKQLLPGAGFGFTEANESLTLAVTGSAGNFDIGGNLNVLGTIDVSKKATFHSGVAIYEGLNIGTATVNPSAVGQIRITNGASGGSIIAYDAAYRILSIGGSSLHFHLSGVDKLDFDAGSGTATFINVNLNVLTGSALIQNNLTVLGQLTRFSNSDVSKILWINTNFAGELAVQTNGDYPLILSVNSTWAAELNSSGLDIRNGLAIGTATGSYTVGGIRQGSTGFVGNILWADTDAGGGEGRAFTTYQNRGTSIALPTGSWAVGIASDGTFNISHRFNNSADTSDTPSFKIDTNDDITLGVGRIANQGGTTSTITNGNVEAIFSVAANQIWIVSALATDGSTSHSYTIVVCESDSGTNWATLNNSGGITITNSGTSVRVANNSGGDKAFRWTALRIL